MADSRIRREVKTVAVMISLYCKDIHHNDGLCRECAELKNYALQRLAKCPFQSAKPTCAACPVHCYQPALRARIKQIMRYAGPRMIYRHPVMAVIHIIDGRRKAAPVSRQPPDKI